MLVFIIEDVSRKINSGPRRPGSQQTLPEVPGDRLAQALLQGENGLEAQLAAGLADVGDPAVGLHLLDLAEVGQAVPGPEEAFQAFRGDRGQVGRPDGDVNGHGPLSQETAGDAADVLPTAGPRVGDVEDLPAGPSRVAGHQAGPDGVP